MTTKIKRKESKYVWNRIDNCDFENKDRFWPVFSQHEIKSYSGYFGYVSGKFVKLNNLELPGDIRDFVSNLKMYNRDT